MEAQNIDFRVGPLLLVGEGLVWEGPFWKNISKSCSLMP